MDWPMIAFATYMLVFLAFAFATGVLMILAIKKRRGRF
jgi:hypothetical protein